MKRNKNFDFKIKQFPVETRKHGGVFAGMGCMGLTFLDDITRFYKYCREYAPKIAEKIAKEYNGRICE